MPTLRQKRLAQAIVKNATAKKPKNKKELLVSAGYDIETAKATPGRTIDQKGVREELQVLGFDPLTAAGVVSDLMRSKKINPLARLKAADMTFKVHGTYAPEKKLVGISVMRELTDDELRNIATTSESGTGEA